MSQHVGALASAAAQFAAVRDDPAARLALMARVFPGPTGRAPRHLPFRRAALSFMRWQARRGVLNPLDASPSQQWRTVQEEDQQNRQLLDLSEQILQLTKAVHEYAQAATGAAGRAGARDVGADRRPTQRP